MSVRGEHDLSTQSALAEALQEAASHSSVLVDLTDCSFIDSSVIATLIGAARAIEERGDRCALAVPPEQRSVARIAEMTRLGEIVAVHPSRDAGIADLEQFARSREQSGSGA